MQRHSISRLPDEDNNKPTTPKKYFKTYLVGYIHIDITQAYTQQGKLYLLVAIDRASKYTYVELHDNKTGKTANEFLKKLIKNLPNKVHTILTDNGLQSCNSNKNSNQHKQELSLKNFHATSQKYQIKHKYTQAYHPWTNGQEERIEL